MKWQDKATLLIQCLLIVSFLFVPLVFAPVYYNANTYPFTFDWFPNSDTAMGFSTDMTFQTAYRENNYWYFNTSSVPDLYGFQVQVATLLITDYFASSSDQLKFSVTASVGVTSITKIIVPSKGQPYNVVGETSWSWDSPSKTVTINVYHSISTVNIEVDWMAPFSQSSSYYSLTVTVQSGSGVVANAKVSVAKASGVTVASKLSDKFGRASFSGLAQDSYDIIVESDYGVGLEKVHLDRNKEVTVVVGSPTPWLTIPKSAEEFVTSLGQASEPFVNFLVANLGAVALAFLGFVSVYYGKSEDDNGVVVVGCVLLVVAVGVYFLPSFL